MPKRPRGPVLFDLEADGSVGLVVSPSDKRRRIYFPVGYIRASEDGGFLCSTTFEEMQRYEEWGEKETVEDAVSALISWEIGKTQQNGESGEEEVGKIRSLQTAASLIQEVAPRAKRALAASAANAVTAAVENMLRVATYDEVMDAVSRALVKEVLGS